MQNETEQIQRDRDFEAQRNDVRNDNESVTSEVAEDESDDEINDEHEVEINENDVVSEDENGVANGDNRSGYVALIGRPNAGKSTLLNKLVGEKIAAVSNKPQTTRFAIQGIVTRPAGQIVFVDTPGVHKPGYLLNRRMMSAVHEALHAVDVIVLMRDASVPSGNGDNFVLQLVKDAAKPAILALNKIDKVKDKSELLPLIEWYANQFNWETIIPISARQGREIDILSGEVIKRLPHSEPIFAEDELTDQPLRVMVGEIVREKILRQTGEELPYTTAVITEKFDESEAGLVRIYCAIYVERDSQKKIIVGKGGARIKEIGTQARQDILKLLGDKRKVYLELFVKVKPDWRDDKRALSELGINESKR